MARPRGECVMSVIKKRLLSALVASFALFLLQVPPAAKAEGIKLPEPSFKGKMSVEEALKARRTCRSFQSRGLSLAQLSQILWAADGVSGSRYDRPLRTAPSAGALYPLDLYAVVGQGGVGGLKPAVYHFDPAGHGLTAIRQGDLRQGLAEAAVSQMRIAKAPVIVVITGEYERCTRKYHDRGVLYTHIEAGCVGQNIFLQAEALGLKAGIVGAFRNSDVIKTLGLPPSHEPLLLMTVGYAE